MKRNTKSSRLRSRHTYSEEQLAGLRISTATRKQETVERLRTAIASLKKKEQAITAQSIYEECGLRYASYVRNNEAIALLRANSTHLLEKKRRTKPGPKMSEETASLHRDPLFNYKKPQLVSRLREAQQQILELQQQLATLADACLLRDTQVVELEAKLMELEP